MASDSSRPEIPATDALVLRALAELNMQPGPAAAQARVCRAVRELFGAGSAWLAGRSLAYDPDIPARAAPDRFTYAESVADGSPSPEGRVPEALFPALGAQAVESRGRLFIARSGTASGPAAEVLSLLGAGTLLVRPVRIGGEVWGHLAAAGPAALEPSDETLAAFEMLAASVDGLVGHMQTEARLGLSHRISQQLIEQIPVALFVIDSEHRIALINGRMADIAGKAPAEILRDGCIGLFCEGKTHYEKCPGMASLRTGSNWDGEIDLNKRHYAVVVRPLRFGDKVPYSLVMLTDRSEQHRNQRLLRTTVARLERLLVQSDRIRGFLTKLATSQNPVEVRNHAIEAAAELLEATCAYLIRIRPDGTEETDFRWFREPSVQKTFDREVKAGTLSDFVRDSGEVIHLSGQGQTERERLFDKALASTGCNRLFVEPVHCGDTLWGRMGFAINAPGPISRDDIDLLHEMVAMVEISIRRSMLLEEVRRKEKSLVEAVAKAEAGARAKTMFLATMSHEIRTPLNAIIGFSDTLGRISGLPAESRECTEGISRAANALLDLLNDILDFSKLESGADVEMLRGECDIPALFAEMETVFRYGARARGIELRHSVPDGFPLLRLSKTRFRQIMLNLIGNAVKFTQKGFVEWKASCEPAGEGAVSLAIDVRDTGIGISAQDIETVFDPFVQSGTIRPDARTQKGTGLGLPIVRRLVEACGGSVNVESELGKGSVFRIRIGRVETIASSGTEMPAAQSRPASLPEGFAPMLVDDIAINLRILALHFRNIGILDTMQAEGAEAALEMMRSRRPSAVFTDLWMPGTDGSTLARKIKSDPAFTGIPVVAVTADSDAAASFDASVFDDILVKPIDTAKVSECLARLFPST